MKDNDTYPNPPKGYDRMTYWWPGEVIKKGDPLSEKEQKKFDLDTIKFLESIARNQPLKTEDLKALQRLKRKYHKD